jgi:outer membrane protein OmpA-like peptidoglycan-associated protein
VTPPSTPFRLARACAAATALLVIACATPQPSALEQASTTLQDNPLPEKPPPPPAVGPAPKDAASAPASRPVKAGTTPAAKTETPASPPATQPAVADEPAAATAEPAAPAGPEPSAGPYESALVRYDGENIWLGGKVGFDSSHRFIRESSRPVLDEVARMLQARPEIARVEIQGHRHSKMKTGGEKITQTRAEAVRDYLIGKGIDKARLTAVGYGSQVPVDTNRTEEGRAANTRIELIILEHKK